jgi:CO/xanthine dehydrogenase FAD-binding subunit
MNKFAYLRPVTLQEVFSLLKDYGEKAKVIAGGTDVMVGVKARKEVPAFLIALKHLPELSYISGNGSIRIGSCTTLTAIQRDPIISERVPVLKDAVDNIGSVQVRNVGTIGGNICNAAPSSDTGVALLSLGAKVQIVCSDGERTVALEDFFLGPNKTILAPGEIVSGFVIPQPQPYTGGAYWKHTRRKALQLPLIGVGVTLSLGEDLLTCKDAKIALGVAAPTPMRAKEAERILIGHKIDNGLLDKAGEVAARESRVRDSIRCAAWYRRAMIKVYVRRMGNLACERARNAK